MAVVLLLATAFKPSVSFEKFNESLSKMKKERDLCVNGAINVTKNLQEIEKNYHEESYENNLKCDK